MESLKVLTLNSWGIPYLSKYAEERMSAIADELAKGDYNIVSLQEVWFFRHYQMVSERVKLVLPYSHYFHSGFIGSGCAIFSRYPIVDTFFHKYVHNGYFWDVAHGDWFGGKGAGCVIIQHPKRKIYVFNTHLHADYNPDVFTECRTLQMYQLSQLVRHTTRPGDAIIICGDFNHRSDELGLKAILEFTRLNDSYEVASTKPSECFTLNNQFNKFTGVCELVSRIDFILTSNVFEVTSCALAMQKIPNSNLHFSDHEGYTATLLIKEPSECNTQVYTDDIATYQYLKEVNDVINLGEKLSSEINWWKILIWVLFMMFVLMPFFSIDTFHAIFPAITTWKGKCIFFMQIISVIVCIVYVWVSTVVRGLEVKAFKNVSADIKVRLLALEDKMNDKKCE